MAGRCGCTGCATGAYGAYVQLLHSAQADQDGAHRQLAMAAIGRIAPFAGGSNTATVDGLAQPHLDRLYPPPPSAPPVIPPEVQQILDECRARTDTLIAAYRAGGS